MAHHLDPYDKTIQTWDTNTGAAFGKPLEGNTGSVRSVACTPDGQHTISGRNDKTNHVWNSFPKISIHHLYASGE